MMRVYLYLCDVGHTPMRTGQHAHGARMQARSCAGLSVTQGGARGTVHSQARGVGHGASQWHGQGYG